MFKRLCYLPHNQQGFTLIELLVVVIIIGVLAAIALPNLLSNVSKAKEAEAITRVREYIASQATYRMEKGDYSDDLHQLGIDSSGSNYTYEIDNAGVESKIVAIPKTKDVKAVVGGVAIASNQFLFSGICKASKSGQEFAQLSEVSFNYGSKQIGCGKGLRRL